HPVHQVGVVPDHVDRVADAVLVHREGGRGGGVVDGHRGAVVHGLEEDRHADRLRGGSPVVSGCQGDGHRTVGVGHRVEGHRAAAGVVEVDRRHRDVLVAHHALVLRGGGDGGRTGERVDVRHGEGDRVVRVLGAGGGQGVRDHRRVVDRSDGDGHRGVAELVVGVAHPVREADRPVEVLRRGEGERAAVVDEGAGPGRCLDGQGHRGVTQPAVVRHEVGGGEGDRRVLGRGQRVGGGRRNVVHAGDGDRHGGGGGVLPVGHGERESVRAVVVGGRLVGVRAVGVDRHGPVGGVALVGHAVGEVAGRRVDVGGRQ